MEISLLSTRYPNSGTYATCDNSISPLGSTHSRRFIERRGAIAILCMTGREPQTDLHVLIYLEPARYPSACVFLNPYVQYGTLLRHWIVQGRSCPLRRVAHSDLFIAGKARDHRSRDYVSMGFSITLLYYFKRVLLQPFVEAFRPAEWMPFAGEELCSSGRVEA